MKLLIQPNCGFPTYVQIASGICNEIGWRRLKMGDTLPPTRVLAAENGLDHKTVARAYAELRSQGVAYPSRPTGPYVVMSQTQHIAEAQRDYALKIMEALLRAMRCLRRMPPEIEPHKSIQECLEKFRIWEARLNGLQQTIDAERSKPAAGLPGIISPIGIDEALARRAAEKAASKCDPANSTQEMPMSEAPWNNSKNVIREPSAPDTESGPSGLAQDSGHSVSNLDTPWNNSRFAGAASASEISQKGTIEDIPWNNSTNNPPVPAAPTSHAPLSPSKNASFPEGNPLFST